MADCLRTPRKAWRHGVARVLCLKLLDGGGIRRELSPDGVYPKGVG